MRRLARWLGLGHAQCVSDDAGGWLNGYDYGKRAGVLLALEWAHQAEFETIGADSDDIIIKLTEEADKFMEMPS